VISAEQRYKVNLLIEALYASSKKAGSVVTLPSL
jgi:hypothetical protein